MRTSMKYNSRNDYHQFYRNRSFGIGNHKFSGGIPAQIMLPRIDSTRKVTKSSSIKGVSCRALKTFCKNVGKLTRDQEILEIMTGYTIQILSKVSRKSVLTSWLIESVLIEREVEDLLSKEVITSVQRQPLIDVSQSRCS